MVMVVDWKVYGGGIEGWVVEMDGRWGDCK
jgi:hypothetical protein